MALASPITLSGANLGERHRCLNSLVSRAAARGQLSFADLERLPEQTAVDRLFKIDLAIKLNNVDYVLNNVKHEDMLYVNRALKCKWLVERRDVINPQYLEQVLFPLMVMPAISKMKHWLYINLTDPLACQEFYHYYKSIKFDFAVKFLRHCNNEFLESEFPKILVQITPHYLKVIAEKCPRFVKVYYDALATDTELVKRYLKEEQTFYNSIKCILKSEPKIFLDITERYHSLTRRNKLSPSATDYILRYHKNRVMAKSELYVTHILHIRTVAHRLSVEECQEVVVKLARADYLSWWFSYPNVEPLVKRVSRADRATFKKRVFVEKDVGELVTKWPYTSPASPVLPDTSSGEPHVFDDQEYLPNRMKKYQLCTRKPYREPLAAAKPIRTRLDKLFHWYRHKGFQATLFEVKNQVGLRTFADRRRRDMLLVLVSKSGGHADNVSALLQLAMRLRNEPVHERAAVVRSLVKRASAWRLPQHVWDTMLEYAHGLGLDGAQSEVDCREGLHAVVLRQLLAAEDCELPVRTAFIRKFSTLTEYKLTASERPRVAAGLQNILIAAAAEVEPYLASWYLVHLLDVYENYQISFESAISVVVALANRNISAASKLLERLYKARVGRRELLRQYLHMDQAVLGRARLYDAALVNALRHEPHAINIDWLLSLAYLKQVKTFFTKLAIYFNEAGGFAEHVRQTLQDKIAQEPRVSLARPLATLAGRDIESIWRAQDMAGGKCYKLAAALRANMHRARSAPDALALGWREAGMKAVAWRVMRCPLARITQLVQKLLGDRVRRTVRLALALARRTDCPVTVTVKVFSIAETIRPLAALRAAVLFYRGLDEAADPRIWEIVKSHLSTVNLRTRKGLKCTLSNIAGLSHVIHSEYQAMLFLALDKLCYWYRDAIRPELMKCLPKVNDGLLGDVLLLTLEDTKNENWITFYPAIVIRYLMLSKSHEEERSRYEKIGEPFLKNLSLVQKTGFRQQDFLKKNLDQLFRALQYNHVFFDNKYQCCVSVIERILTWSRKFLPEDNYFNQYVQIHATMLYFRAVRHSMKQRPEVFEDPTKKMSEGVDVVGFTFGRYVVKEVAQLKSQYFESIIDLYREGFTSYLTDYFMYGQSRAKFIAAVVKGMLSESEGNEARLAFHVINMYRNVLNDDVFKEFNEDDTKHANIEYQFFAYALMFI